MGVSPDPETPEERRRYLMQKRSEGKASLSQLLREARVGVPYI